MRERLLLNLPFLLMAGMVFFTSCKKNDVSIDVEPNTERVIAEFTEAANGDAVATDFSSGWVTVDLTEIRLNPRSKTYNKVIVKFVINPTVVADYNSANGTNYVMPPATAYNFESNEVVLSQNEKKAMIRVRLNPPTLVSASYAIGLSIAEVSEGEISKTAQNIFISLSVKNKYDGVYSLKGFGDIPGSSFTGPYNLPCAEDLWLVTSGVNSVYIDPAHPAYNGATFAYITNALPDFTVNPGTNKITGVTARPGSLGFIFPYDASYDSRYDPATKTFYIKFGIVPAGSGRYFEDTLIYCKPR